ncbi:MAG: putative DNA binding domain-containing protein [Balneolales bacterium]|nr:putative DNA binding domain-containing protein [Balneolales bacterium]
MKTICAFANDINEHGGGYLVFGIEEQDGSPVLPPEGIQQNQIDKIQKECLNLCKKIHPNLFPEIEPVEFQGKHIIIVWVLTGEERPYSAPTTLGRNSQRRIYVRQGSNTIQASPAQEQKLRELAAHRYFDDRINTQANLSDLDLGLIRTYLQETKSQLYDLSSSMTMEELSQKMQIARGPVENIKPLNIGLLLFSKNPETFFQGCQTNLVEFEDEAGTKYAEKQFNGPVHIQIREIMTYLNNDLIKQYTYKSSQKQEVDKFFNYPYAALEEAVVNALYHRSYENPTINEIRIHRNRIDNHGLPTGRVEILSYPGPMPPVDENALAQLNVVARNYRNIRMGDFLKNMRLAEKVATGIPTMRLAMEKNGSSLPILSTDEAKSYFMAVFKIHPDTPIEVSAKVEEVERVSLSNAQQSILEKLMNEPSTAKDLEEALQTKVSGELAFLKEKGLIGQKEVGDVSLYFINERGSSALKTSF